METWKEIIAIVIATFISEDLTCISTGLLIRNGEIEIVSGILACTVGIFLGDLGLFFLGQLLSSPMQKLSFLKKYNLLSFQKISQKLQKDSWKLIVIARFVPGLRLPVYIGAGLLSQKIDLTKKIILYTFLAGLVWTPILVGISIYIGAEIQSFFEKSLQNFWLAILFSILVLYLGLRLVFLLASQEGRYQLKIKCKKISQVEFWPPFFFYLPLLPGWIYWSIRYKGFQSISTCNPTFQAGGIIGESKSEILKLLPSQCTLKHVLIAPTKNIKNRFLLFERKCKNWKYPIVFKPNFGQRGIGVKIIQNKKEAKEYLSKTSQDIIVQKYHLGPYEVGIFYYRRPYEEKGSIFSITHKIFPILKGDGISTLENLIKKHPRYQMQYKLYIERLERKNISIERVLKKGEKLTLGSVGNHCQGTQFEDGAFLYSPALHQRIDKISKKIKGFYLGRFDIRYSNVKAFREGKDINILELNGATSESTNIYDPRFSIFQVYYILYKTVEFTF